MRVLKLTAQVDEYHQLRVSVPSEIPPGPIEIVIPLVDGEDDAGAAWAAGIAHQWSAELADIREDIYTLNDGEPVDGTRVVSL